MVYKQVVYNENLDKDDLHWHTGTANFKANKKWNWIGIKFNPVGHGQASTGKKISGIFLDNIKLYEKCENEYNQCLNQNYRCDMLDVEIKNYKWNHPSYYLVQNNNNFLKTFQIKNLDNVQHSEIRIYNPQGNNVRDIVLDFPPSTFVWDGTNGFGNLLP